MEGLISVLGGTPLGILITSLFIGMLILAWTSSRYITSFRYHELDDRKEFTEIRQELDKLNADRREDFQKIFDKLDSLENKIHSTEIALTKSVISCSSD